MANSRIGNYQLEFAQSGWTAPIRSHQHAVYVLPLTAPTSGQPANTIDLQLKGGGSDTLQNVANLYSSFLVNNFPSTIDTVNFTLWRYVTENSRDFVTAGIAVPTTTGTGAPSISHYVILSYRTAGGSILKQVLLESNNGGDTKAALIPNATGTRVERLAAYTLSAASPIIGIDNTFAVAPLFDSRGENETVWRKVYRA